jgi:hypothetical protein
MAHVDAIRGPNHGMSLRRIEARDFKNSELHRRFDRLGACPACQEHLVYESLLQRSRLVAVKKRNRAELPTIKGPGYAEFP